MIRQIVFFQGGGDQKDHDADKLMVASLQSNLGDDYHINYPLFYNTKDPDLGRREQIGREIRASHDNIILVAHSLGASMLLAHLSENNLVKKIAGVFLISTPYWTGDEDWVKGFKLRDDFASHLDKQVPLYFYHTRDDKEVPFAQFEFYKRALPWATFRDLSAGGHNLNNNLALVAADIRLV